MAMTIKEAYRFNEIAQKVRTGEATTLEKDEYMNWLYTTGKITKQQHESYLANKSNKELLNTAAAIGTIILIGFLLGKLFDD